MPRNSSGTYSLPAGNPVVTATVISSTWANTTLDDIRTAMTDSLDRNGRGGMLASLALFVGTIGSPGLTWTAEPTSGLYRAGAGDFRYSIAAVDYFGITTAGANSTGLSLSSTNPLIRQIETDAAVNNKVWYINVDVERMLFQVVNDAQNSASSWMIVDRTLNVVDSIALTSTALTWNGTAISTLTLANPSGLIGMAAVNGVATTALRSDGRHAIDPAIAPTWTGVHTFTSSGSANAAIFMSSNTPTFCMNETDGAANNRRWDIQANAEQLVFYASNDAISVSTAWLTVDRTGTTIDTVNFNNGVLQYGGIEVGYRGLPRTAISGNYTVLTTDAGKVVRYTGTGGHTITFDSNPAVNTIVTLVHAGAGTITITPSVALDWYNGSGTIGSGNRTMAVGGVATLTVFNTVGNWSIWGTGLS